MPILELPGRGRLGLDISQVYNSSGVGTFIDADVSGGNLAQIAWMQNLNGGKAFGGMFYAKYGVINGMGFVSEGMLADTAVGIADIISKLTAIPFLDTAVQTILSYVHIEIIDNSSVHIYIPQLQPVVGAVKGAREPRGLIGEMTEIVKIERDSVNGTGMPEINLDVKQFIMDTISYVQSGNIGGALANLVGLQKHPLETLSVVMNDGSTISFEQDKSVNSLDHSFTDNNHKKLILYTTKQPDDEGKYILVYDFESAEYIFMRGDGVKYHISPKINPVVYVGGGDINEIDIYNSVSENFELNNTHKALTGLLLKLSSMVQLKGIPYGVVTSVEDPEGNRVAINYENEGTTVPIAGANVTIDYGVRRITNVTDALGRNVTFNYNEGFYTTRDNWESFRLKEIVYPDGRKTSYSYTGDQAREQPTTITIADPKGRNTVIEYKVATQNQHIGDSFLTADVGGAFFYINRISYPIGGGVEYESSPIDPDRTRKQLYHDINLTDEFVMKRKEYPGSGAGVTNITTFTYEFEKEPSMITTGGLYLNLNILDLLTNDYTDNPVGLITSLLKGGVYMRSVIEVKSGKTTVQNMNGRTEVYNFKKNQIGNFNQWMFSLSASVSLDMGIYSLVFGTDRLQAGYMPARLLQTSAVVSEKKGLGRYEFYKYDGLWNITNKRIVDGLNDYSFSYEYDIAGNLVHEKGPLNYEVVRVFTPGKYPGTTNIPQMMITRPNDYMNYFNKNRIVFFPGLLWYEKVYNNGGWQEKSYEYDGYSDNRFTGRMRKENLPEGITSEYFYTPAGDVAWVKDGLGRYTYLGYDYNYNNGKEIRIDKTNKVTTRTLNGQGAVVQTEQYAVSSMVYNRANHWMLYQTDPMGQKSAMQYDILGRVTNVILPDNTTQIYRYDDTPGNMVVDVQDSKQQTDGSKIRYYYDGLGRLTSLWKYTNGVVYSAASNFYKPWGELESVVDFTQRRTTLSYDSLGRLTKIIYPDNSVVTAAYTTMVSENNHAVILTNERGLETYYTFDLRDKLLSVRDSSKMHTYYTYDDVGNLTAFKDAGGNGVRYQYDSLNRLKKEIYQNDSEWNYTYDFNGNLTTKKDANNQTYTFTYDEANRLVQSVFGNETSVFGYDLSGKSLFWKNVNAEHTNATTYNYNSRGWVTSERQTIEGRTNIISYFYNSIGGLTNEIYPSGTNVARTYDGLHRLTAITAGTASVRYNYLKNDLIDSMRYGNGLIQAFMYDKRDRVTSFWISNTGMAPVLKQSYTYDASGNRTNFTDERGYSVNYAYDELDRLAKIIYPESVGDASYFYDNTGNRFEYYYPYGHHSYTYNNLNELTRMTVNRNGSVEFGYDRNGNQTSEIHKAGNDTVKEIRYNWGANDRLDRMEFPQLKPDSYGTKVLDFVYTPAGNRVRKTYKDNLRTYTDRLYIYNGAGTLVEEFDIKTNKLETIHIGNIRIEDNHVEYDCRDMLSSTVLISDAAGKVLQRYRYDPFGEIEQAKGNSDNRFLFNGKEADESGLSYYGARYYNSITGRWISRDPLSGKLLDPQTLNRYHFSLNNPLRYIDPDGRSVLDDLQTFFKYLDPRTIDKSYADLATGQISYQDFIMKAGLHEEAKAYAQYMPQVLEAYTIVIGGPELGIMSKSEMIFGKMVFQNAGKATEYVGQIVLGRFPDYVDKATELGAKRFNVPTQIWDCMTATEKWIANQKFLDRAIKRGDDIILASPISEAKKGTFFKMEIDYLLDKGYQLSDDGKKMIIK